MVRQPANSLWDAYERAYGNDDADEIVWHATTREMNPTVKQSVIDRAMTKDAPKALAEFMAEFRKDIEGFLDLDLIRSAIEPGVVVRPRMPRESYFAFTDTSGGRQDSFTLAIGHREDDTAVIDFLYEKIPPFDPEDAFDEVVRYARIYGVRKMVGDNFAGELVAGRFKRRGMPYDKSEKPRSDLYLNALPVFTSGRVRLLDNDRLVDQLMRLERRTGPSGRDSVNHPSRGGQHDDLANAVAGVIWLIGASAGSEWMSHIGAALPNAQRWLAGMPPVAGTAPSPMAAAVQRARTFQFHSGRGSGYQPATGPSWTRGRFY